MKIEGWKIIENSNAKKNEEEAPRDDWFTVGSRGTLYEFELIVWAEWNEREIERSTERVTELECHCRLLLIEAEKNTRKKMLMLT